MKKSPKQVKYKGKYYPIDNSVMNVIEIYDWIINGDLDEIDQGIMIVTKTFGTEAPVEQKLIDYASSLILVKNEEQIKKTSSLKEGKRDMCFVQDFPIYRADIIREYGVDIADNTIDFPTLVMLLENLSSRSRFNEIRELRNKKLSDIKDAKLRKEYKEAQDYYKLKDTSKPKEVVEEEKEMNNKINELAELFI